jgi:MAternally-affected-uncoordination protein
MKEVNPKKSCWLWVWQSQSLVQIVDWHERFPRMLQGSQSNVQLLLGHYSHSVGCFHEAALHFLEGAKLTESEGLKAMCNMNAAVSFICIGDSDSSSQVVFSSYASSLSSLLYSVQQVCFALEGFNNASAYHQDLVGLQALDLIAPVYRMMDSYVGVREKTLVLFASGLHQTKQHNLQEARYEVDSKLIPAVLTTFQ